LRSGDLVISAKRDSRGQITRSPDHPITRLFLIPLLAVAAALSPDADSAISRLSRHHADGAAHTASFTHLYTPAGFSTSKRETGTIWIQKPERLRFDYLAPEKKTFTYDAGEGRLYSPEDGQLTVQKLSSQDRARLPILFLADPTGLLRDYEVTAEPTGDGATTLVLKPRTPRPELAWLRVRIDREGAVPELSYEDSSGNHTEFRFEQWRKVKARSASDYRVTGPPGTRVLEN
jgi:outer membrane lipoprotein-sorting protein